MEIATIAVTPPRPPTAAGGPVPPAPQPTPSTGHPDSGAGAPTATDRPSDAGWAERRIVVDPGTQQLVTETIDAGTREVVVQTPDRAALGLRAYFDTLALRQEQAAHDRGETRHVLPALIA